MSEEHTTSQGMKMSVTAAQSCLRKIVFYTNLGSNNNENYYFCDC